MVRRSAPWNTLQTLDQILPLALITFALLLPLDYLWWKLLRWL